MATPPDHIPTATPVDAAGASLIPELRGREPTHNEREIIAGDWINVGSTNIKRFKYDWQAGGGRLYVDFVSGGSGYYDRVPLSVVVGLLETESHGRYHARVLAYSPAYPWTPLGKGSGRGRPQVVRGYPS